MDEKLERFDVRWQDLEGFVRSEAVATGVYLDSDVSQYLVDRAAKAINAAPPASTVDEQIDLAKSSFSGVIFGIALGMEEEGLQPLQTIHLAEFQSLRLQGWFCGFRPWC